jgi:hypothetical protein
MNVGGPGESQGLNPELINVSRASSGDVNIEINPAAVSGGSGPSGGSEKKAVSVGQLDYRLDKTVGKIETAITEDGDETRQEVANMAGDLASVSEDMGHIAKDTSETRSVIEKKVVPVLIQTAEDVGAISENLDATSQEVTQILELVKQQNGGNLPPGFVDHLLTKKDLEDAIKQYNVILPPELQSTLGTIQNQTSAIASGVGVLQQGISEVSSAVQESGGTLKRVESTQEAQSGAMIDIGRTQDAQTEMLGRIESALQEIKSRGEELTPEKITEIVKANPGITEAQLQEAIEKSELKVTDLVTRAANAVIQETRQGTATVVREIQDANANLEQRIDNSTMAVVGEIQNASLGTAEKIAEGTAENIAALNKESQVLQDKIDALNQQIATADIANRESLTLQAEESKRQFEALTAQIKALEAQKVISQRADILRNNPGLRELAKKDAIFGLRLGQAIARIEAGEDVDTVVQDVIKDVEEHDPQKIEQRATTNARNVGYPDGSGNTITLGGLETENPALRDKIRASTLDELTKRMLNEDLSPDDVTRTIVDLASSGTIDQAMALDVLNNYRNSSLTKAKELISQYETGVIPSIEQLQKAAELLPPSSLARSMIEQRITQDQELIDWNKSPHTMDEQIAHVVETLPEPQKTIHKNILESAKNQQKLKRETLAKGSKAIEAEENARKQAEIEKTLRKLWIIARVGGPILTLALLGAAGGAGFGAVAGSFGVGVSGFFIGGAIGTGAGVLIGGRYGFEHGFADWRKLNTLSARSEANIAKLRENAGALAGQIDVGELNVSNLVAETAIQQEIQKRGLKSQADIQALTNQMLTQLGASRERQNGIRQATAAIYSMRTA